MDLQPLLHKKVLVLTSDSRLLIGTLLSTDQTTNLVLKDTVERIFNPYKQIELGILILRGDLVVMVGLLDELRDELIKWDTMKIQGIKPSK